MLGVRSAQRGLLEADHLYLDYVGRGSFYGFLASLRGQRGTVGRLAPEPGRQRAPLFRDEEFAELYCPDNGRDSVPPSLVATALLLQAYDKVSDAEAKQRSQMPSVLVWAWALFRDEEFAELYCPDNGRDSVPPSLVATALLLQAYDKVSDAEAKQRSQMPSVLVWAWALWCGVPDAAGATAVMAAASMRNTRMAAVSPLGWVVIAFWICGIIDALLDVGVGNQGPGVGAGVFW